MVPFQRAARVRAGGARTVITRGALVRRAWLAASEAAELGGEVEILDLRTIAPYDWEAIAESVARTGKALVAHEDALTSGFCGEIAARIAEDLYGATPAKDDRMFVRIRVRQENGLLPAAIFTFP